MSDTGRNLTLHGSSLVREMFSVFVFRVGILAQVRVRVCGRREGAAECSDEQKAVD